METSHTFLYKKLSSFTEGLNDKTTVTQGIHLYSVTTVTMLSVAASHVCCILLKFLATQSAKLLTVKH